MESQEQSAGGAGGQDQAPRLPERVRNVMRLHHYPIRTERTSVDWIKRYVVFHHMRSREDLANGEGKIEAFCTDLAVNGKVAPWTQNQALRNCSATATLPPR